MSEKRFTFNREVEFEIFDNVTKKSYDGTVGCQEKICQLLNDQQAIIHRDELSIHTMMSNMEKLEEENEQLQKEKEYYREYALQYLLEYEFYSDNFLNTIKNTISEEEVKKIKEEENKIIEALKKEGLYE